MKFTSYDTIEEMFESLKKAMDAADKRVKPWQEKMTTPGTYFYQEYEEFIIWGEILNKEEFLSPDEEEAEWEKQERANPALRNYRFCRCFSPLCPEGELGDVHVSEMSGLITKKTFEKARKNNWFLTLIFE